MWHLPWVCCVGIFSGRSDDRHGGSPASLADIARADGLTKQTIAKRQEKALKRLDEMIGE